jgi:hypothetical protein
MSSTSTRRLRSPVRHILAPLSINEVDVRLTCTYDKLLHLRPNMGGEPTTHVMLSISEGKLGRTASRKTEEPCTLGVDVCV